MTGEWGAMHARATQQTITGATQSDRRAQGSNHEREKRAVGYWMRTGGGGSARTHTVARAPLRRMIVMYLGEIFSSSVLPCRHCTCQQHRCGLMHTREPGSSNSGETASISARSLRGNLPTRLTTHATDIERQEGHKRRTQNLAGEAVGRGAEVVRVRAHVLMVHCTMAQHNGTAQWHAHEQPHSTQLPSQRQQGSRGEYRCCSR